MLNLDSIRLLVLAKTLSFGKSFQLSTAIGPTSNSLILSENIAEPGWNSCSLIENSPVTSIHLSATIVAIKQRASSTRTPFSV